MGDCKGCSRENDAATEKFRFCGPAAPRADGKINSSVRFEALTQILQSGGYFVRFCHHSFSEIEVLDLCAHSIQMTDAETRVGKAVLGNRKTSSPLAPDDE